MWTKNAQPVRTTGPAAPGHPMEERRTVVWVGKSVMFKGDLSSAEDMALDGHFEGRINVGDHSLTIGPDADIRADIVCKIVSIRGRVKGQITASDQIHLHETASIEGNLSSPGLVIADGAQLVGRVEETPKQLTDAHAQSRVPATFRRTSSVPLFD